jgi:serine/threonine protein kinase
MAGQLRIKSGKTFHCQVTSGDVIGRGAFGGVFKGHFKSNIETSWQQAAIKRVELKFQKDKWMDIENDREVVALKELRHPCIVTLYAVEDDNDFRYCIVFFIKEENLIFLNNDFPE